MKEIFRRFMFLFHWIGFLCLVGFIGFFGLEISLNGYDYDLLEAIELLFETLAFKEEAISVMLWLGIAHWPIKWILTGNKSFFPWKGE
jgi:hypothetical protein